MSSDSPHPTPHDALFKRVFGDVRRGAALLRSILPPVLAERVDWDSVELRSGSYVDAKLKGLASDLVLSAQIDGQPALFYLSIISGKDEDLVHQVMGHLSQPVREDFMELEEMLAQKKLEQGREQGRAEGRAEGGAAMLLKLLRGKFTNVPDAVDARVRAATADELDRWAERVHTAESLDDVLR